MTPPDPTPASIAEIQALVNADGIPRCLNCGKKMRFNVPRMGPAGGYVHNDTDQLSCGPKVELQITMPPTSAEAVQAALNWADTHPDQTPPLPARKIMDAAFPLNNSTPSELCQIILAAEVRSLRDGIKLILADPATLRANILRYGPEGYDVCHREEIDRLRADVAELVKALKVSEWHADNSGCFQAHQRQQIKSVLAKHAEGGAS